MLAANTSGVYNVAVGTSVLNANTTGYNNTAIGSLALSSNTTGFANTAAGLSALSDNITGAANTAIGSSALGSNTFGNYNTATGYFALALNTIGVGNAAHGYSALSGNSSGNFNAADGYAALENNTSGSNNTAVGYSARPAIGAFTLSNTTAIGNGATVSASNTIRLGNSSVTSITGQVAFTASSDRTKKEGFRAVDGDEVLRKLRTLEVTSWNYIGHDATQFRHYGPMAQDFFARFGHDGVGTIGTDVTLNSGDVSGILIAALQAADRRTEALTSEVAELRALVETLMRQIGQPR